MRSLSTVSRSARTLASVAGLAILAVPISACSSESQSASTTDVSSNSVTEAAPQAQAAPAPVAVIDALTGESTAIALDKGFTDALTSLKLKAGVVGDAQLTDGSLVFPITGGNVTVFTPGEVSPYVIGQIQHVNSGLSLKAGGTMVRLTNLNVDPGASRVYGDVSVDNQPVATDAYLFALDGRTLEPLSVQGSQAVLQGTKVEVSDVAAGLLNDTFKTDAVKAGLLVGVATITVDVPAA